MSTRKERYNLADYIRYCQDMKKFDFETALKNHDRALLKKFALWIGDTTELRLFRRGIQPVIPQADERWGALIDRFLKERRDE